MLVHEFKVCEVKSECEGQAMTNTWRGTARALGRLENAEMVLMKGRLDFLQKLVGLRGEECVGGVAATVARAEEKVVVVVAVVMEVVEVVEVEEVLEEVEVDGVSGVHSEPFLWNGPFYFSLFFVFNYNQFFVR